MYSLKKTRAARYVNRSPVYRFGFVSVAGPPLISCITEAAAVTAATEVTRAVTTPTGGGDANDAVGEVEGDLAGMTEAQAVGGPGDAEAAAPAAEAAAEGLGGARTGG
jgi:hypothetical protein